MIFSDHTYSVLIVSASEKFTASIENLMHESEYYPILHADSISSASRECLERTFDFVIINSPLKDDFGYSFATSLSVKQSSVVLMIVSEDIKEEIDFKVNNMGVYTIAKPISVQSFKLALSWMCTSRERIRLLEKKTSSMEDKMKEIRIINKAKWALIDHLKMTEEDAHRYIEKQAMDMCLPKVTVAQNIIKTYF